MTLSHDVLIRAASFDDVDAILKIYNHEIVHGHAVWHEQPFDENIFRTKYVANSAAGFPCFVAEDQRSKQIVGFADYSLFRNFSGYRYSVEHSVYISPAFQGRGLASQLMQHLIQYATAQNMHMMIAAIDAENSASIHLHEKLGFEHTGYMPQVGKKFGQWRDLVLMQLQLVEKNL